MLKKDIYLFRVFLIWLAVFSCAFAQNNIQKGNAAFDKGDFEQAARYYQQALINNKSPLVYANLGHAQSRLENWQKAIDAYQSAIELEEKGPSAQLFRSLGQAQYMADYFDDAAETFQKAYITAPEREDTLWIGRCFIQTDQWTRAQNMLLEHLKKNPENIEALELLAYSFAQSSRTDEAVRIYRKLIRKNPEHTEYLFSLARVQTAANYYDQAIDTLEFAGQITVEQTKQAYQLLADLYVNKKMYQPAAECYQKIILSSDTPSVDDYHRLGYTYFQTGEFFSASEAFEKIMQIDPANDKAALYLGHIAVQKNRTNQAREYYLKAIELNRSSPQPHLALANLELNNSRFNEAAKYFAKAISLDECSPATFYNHVLSLMLAEQPASAKAAIKDALKTHPADEQLNSLLDQLIRASVAD